MKKIISIIAISFLPILNFYAQEELLSKEFNDIKEYRETAAKQKEALIKQSLVEPVALTANKEGYDVKYYSIDLEINPTTRTINGSVLVRAEVVSDSLRIIDLDLMNNMKVDSITQNSSPLTFTHSQNLITTDLSRTYYSNEVFEIKINYSGTPASSGGFNGTPFVFGSYNSKPMIYSTVTSARYWWPCKDFPVFPFVGYPYDKADSMDINISVPANLIVLSNGKLVNVLDSGQNKIYQWQERYAILPMAVSIFIYPYLEYSDWFKYSDSDSMQIKFYYFEDQYSRLYPILSKTKEMLKFFSDLFGLYPYIKEKYGCALWSFINLSMCAQTMTALYYGHNQMEIFVSHELSHQWWWYRNNNDVRHDWLSEGFSDYSAALWGEYKYGSTYCNNFMNQQKYFGGGSIYWEDPSTQNYDVDLIYRKGSWVLHMLRHVLGDSTFFNVLESYATEPAYENRLVTTEDFQNIAERVSGLDLNVFFEQWIYKSGYPSYTYSYTSSKNAENNYDVNVTISQIGTIFQMPVDVTVRTATSDTTFIVNVNQQMDTFQFTISEEPNDVLLDKDGWILCKIFLVPSAIEDEELLLKEYSLSQNYPNPFNSNCAIKYSIPKLSQVSLKIFNVLGSEIETLVDEEKPVGTYELSWNAANLPSGVYFYRLQAWDFVQTRKMILLK